MLDDVLSELDDYRQSHLLNTIQGKVQTFVTTTSVDGIEHETLKEAKTIHVTNGTVDCEIDRNNPCLNGKVGDLCVNGTKANARKCI